MAANKTETFCDNKGICFGAKIKIVWEEQLTDPPIDFITSVNVP